MRIPFFSMGSTAEHRLIFNKFNRQARKAAKRGMVFNEQPEMIQQMPKEDADKAKREDLEKRFKILDEKFVGLEGGIAGKTEYWKEMHTKFQNDFSQRMRDYHDAKIRCGIAHESHLHELGRMLEIHNTNIEKYGKPLPSAPVEQPVVVAEPEPAPLPEPVKVVSPEMTVPDISFPDDAPAAPVAVPDAASSVSVPEISFPGDTPAEKVDAASTAVPEISFPGDAPTTQVDESKGVQKEATNPEAEAIAKKAAEIISKGKTVAPTAAPEVAPVKPQPEPVPSVSSAEKKVDASKPGATDATAEDIAKFAANLVKKSEEKKDASLTASKEASSKEKTAEKPLTSETVAPEKTSALNSTTQKKEEQKDLKNPVLNKAPEAVKAPVATPKESSREAASTVSKPPMAAASSTESFVEPSFPDETTSTTVTTKSASGSKKSSSGEATKEPNTAEEIRQFAKKFAPENGPAKESITDDKAKSSESIPDAKIGEEANRQTGDVSLVKPSNEFFNQEMNRAIKEMYDTDSVDLRIVRSDSFLDFAQRAGQSIPPNVSEAFIKYLKGGQERAKLDSKKKEMQDLIDRFNRAGSKEETAKEIAAEATRIISEKKDEPVINYEAESSPTLAPKQDASAEKADEESAVSPEVWERSQIALLDQFKQTESVVGKNRLAKEALQDSQLTGLDITNTELQKEVEEYRLRMEKEELAALGKTESISKENSSLSMLDRVAKELESKDPRRLEGENAVSILDSNLDLLVAMNSRDNVQDIFNQMDQFRQDKKSSLPSSLKNLATKIDALSTLDSWIKNKHVIKLQSGWHFGSETEPEDNLELHLLSQAIRQDLDSGRLKKEDIAEYLQKVKKEKPEDVSSFIQELERRLPSKEDDVPAANRIPLTGTMFAPEPPHIPTLREKSDEFKPVIDFIWNLHNIVNSKYFNNDQRQKMRDLYTNIMAYPERKVTEEMQELINTVKEAQKLQPLYAWLNLRGTPRIGRKNSIKFFTWSNYDPKRTPAEEGQLKLACSELKYALDKGDIKLDQLKTYAYRVLDMREDQDQVLFAKGIRETVDHEELPVSPTFDSGESEEVIADREQFIRESMNATDFIYRRERLLRNFEKLPSGIQSKWFGVMQLNDEQREVKDVKPNQAAEEVQAQNRAAFGYIHEEDLEALDTLLGRSIPAHRVELEKQPSYFRIEHPEKVLAELETWMNTEIEHQKSFGPKDGEKYSLQERQLQAEIFKDVLSTMPMMNAKIELNEASKGSVDIMAPNCDWLEVIPLDNGAFAIVKHTENGNKWYMVNEEGVTKEQYTTMTDAERQVAKQVEIALHAARKDGTLPEVLKSVS